MSNPLFSERYWSDDEAEFMNSEPTLEELIELENETLDELERQWHVEREREFDSMHGYSISSYDESIDDYFEDIRTDRISGGMSISDAADYYAGKPVVLGTNRFWNPPVKKTLRETTREGYNQFLVNHVAENKELLQKFLDASI